MFDTATGFTVAPIIHGKPACKHVLAAKLAASPSKIPVRARVEHFLAHHLGDTALARRAWKAFDLVSTDRVHMLENGNAIVEGSQDYTVNPSESLCHCADWQKAWKEYIQSLKDADELPTPPVE